MAYDLKQVEELAEGDNEFKETLVKAFVEEIPQDIQALEEAVNVKDHALTYQMAHKMKPNFMMFGRSDLMVLALSIEKMGKAEESFDDIAESFKELKAQTNLMIKAIVADFSL